MTVLEVLNDATGFLEKQGVESPRLNAEHLLAHVLGKKKRIELYLDFERPLGEGERAPLRDLVRQRAEGRPLQHLLGTVDFLGNLFSSDARALIPRPETEQLVELVQTLTAIPDPRVLDVGTGSGVIALSLAMMSPLATVSACDISTDALALARENAVRHGLESRIFFHHADLLSGLVGPFDVIVANLPYIPSDEIPGLSREVRHDPAAALDGGADGIVLIARLIDTAPRVLAPGGLLALEIGVGQSGAVRELLAGKNYRDIATHPDYQKTERFLIARHG